MGGLASVHRAGQAEGAERSPAGRPTSSALVRDRLVEGGRRPARRPRRSRTTSAASRRRSPWAAEHPDEWAEGWSEEAGLPLEVTKVAARARAADIEPISAETVANQQALADRLTADKVLPGEVDFAGIVTKGLVEGGN